MTGHKKGAKRGEENKKNVQRKPAKTKRKSVKSKKGRS